MAVGISVTGDVVEGFEITVTDANEGARLRVLRTDNDGYYSPVAVRGADMISPSGATMVFHDYEAWFNTDLTYTAETYALSDLDTPINTDTATGLDTAVPLGFAMLTQVNDTTERVAGQVTEFKGWSRKAKVLSETDVLGRSKSVVVTDVLGGREGSFDMSNVMGHVIDYDGTGLTTRGKTMLGKWRSVLESGGVLLFRNDVLHSGFDDCYMKIRSVDVNRSEAGPMGTNAPDYPILIYSIDFIEVDRPLTSIAGLGFMRWADLKAANATWAEVSATHADWLSVLTDTTL